LGNDEWEDELEDKTKTKRICAVGEEDNGGTFRYLVPSPVEGHPQARLGMTGRGLGIGIWGEMIVRLARPLWTEWALRDVVGPDDEGWTGGWMGDVE
jgi:hypothetical protein